MTGRSLPAGMIRALAADGPKAGCMPGFGNICGIYDAKPKGFVPGGMSLHNCMLPHRPDLNAYEGASHAALKPEKLDETTSFMFATRFPQHLTEWAAKAAPVQDDDIDCWDSPDKRFNGTPDVK